jgi:hypothetical protein
VGDRSAAHIEGGREGKIAGGMGDFWWASWCVSLCEGERSAVQGPTGREYVSAWIGGRWLGDTGRVVFRLGGWMVVVLQRGSASCLVLSLSPEWDDFFEGFWTPWLALHYYSSLNSPPTVQLLSSNRAYHHHPLPTHAQTPSTHLSSTTLAETQTSARLVTQSRHEWRSAHTRVRAHSCMHANVQLLALRGLFPCFFVSAPAAVRRRAAVRPVIPKASQNALKTRATVASNSHRLVQQVQACHPLRAFNRRPVASYQSN